MTFCAPKHLAASQDHIHDTKKIQLNEQEICSFLLVAHGAQHQGPACSSAQLNCSKCNWDQYTGGSFRGKRWGTHRLVYIAEGIDQLILSKEAFEAPGGVS